MQNGMLFRNLRVYFLLKSQSITKYAHESPKNLLWILSSVEKKPIKAVKNKPVINDKSIKLAFIKLLKKWFENISTIKVIIVYFTFANS